MDYAAATPIDKRVLAVMQPYFSEKFYNPSALYLNAKGAATDLESARHNVAQILGCRQAEVIFTAGGTEANNLAIFGVMEQYPDAEMLVSAIEHDSVIKTSQKYNSRLLQPDEKGVISADKVRESLTDHTVMVSIMYANNEIGTVEPLSDITRIIEATRKDRKQRGSKLPLYLHTDAAQAGNYLDMHVERLGADLMTINGGKLYGPKQSGVLYVRGGIRLFPMLNGGGQEKGLRSGTENLAAVIGFAESLRIAQDSKNDESRRLKRLRALFIQELQQDIPNVIVNGSLKHRLPNNVHITIHGQDNERLVMGLDEKGIMAAAGSACSASSEESSHVLRAIGLSDSDARSSLRFTMGRGTTEDDVRRVVEALAAICAVS